MGRPKLPPGEAQRRKNERLKRWVEANHQRVLDRQAARRATPEYELKRVAYYQANQERLQAKQRAYDSQRRAQNKQRRDAWVLANPDKVQVICQNGRNKRRARLRSAPNKLTNAELASIRCTSHCAYCLLPAAQLELEHCTPLARGGWHTADNVVMACRSCNRSKHAKTVLEFVFPGVFQ